MPRIDVIAAGKFRNGPLLTLWEEYKKRLQWPLALHEIDARKTADEHTKINGKLNSRAFLFVMDERGKSMGSADFAARLDRLAAEGQTHLQFVIGGADGLPEEIRRKAGTLLSFGAQTWPHMMVRVMLIEQIYRAQQILLGHPYHRD